MAGQVPAGEQQQQLPADEIQPKTEEQFTQKEITMSRPTREEKMSMLGQLPQQEGMETTENLPGAMPVLQSPEATGGDPYRTTSGDVKSMPGQVSGATPEMPETGVYPGGRTYADVVTEGEPTEEQKKGLEFEPQKSEHERQQQQQQQQHQEEEHQPQRQQQSKLSKGSSVEWTEIQPSKKPSVEKPSRIELTRTENIPERMDVDVGEREQGEGESYGLTGMIKGVVMGTVYTMMDTAHSVSDRIKDSTNYLIGVTKETAHAGMQKASESTGYGARKVSEGASWTEESVKRGTDYTAEKIKSGAEYVAQQLKSGAEATAQKAHESKEQHEHPEMQQRHKKAQETSQQQRQSEHEKEMHERKTHETREQSQQPQHQDIQQRHSPGLQQTHYKKAHETREQSQEQEREN